MPNELEVVRFLAWLAGFIDGEGTISVTLRQPQPSNRTYHQTFRAYLSIANTSAEVMCFIKTELDGLYQENIGHLGHYKGRKKNHKDHYLLTIAKLSQLQKVLHDLMPHLILKKKQAEIVLSFVGSRLAKGITRHRGSNIDANERGLHAKVVHLNTRGQ